MTAAVCLLGSSNAEGGQTLTHTFRQWRIAIIAVIVFVVGVLIISVVSGRGLSRINWGWVGLVVLGHLVILGPLLSASQRRKELGSDKEAGRGDGER